MDEVAVKKAIEKGNIPLGIFDKIMLVFVSSCVILMIGLTIKSFIAWGVATMLFEFSLLISIIAYSYWQVFSIKKLSPYISNVSFDKKTSVLERILNEYDSNYDTDDREDYIYKFMIVEKNDGNSYYITVIYNESGYYINSNESFGKGYILSKEKTDEIITKIKKLEAEL